MLGEGSRRAGTQPFEERVPLGFFEDETSVMGTPPAATGAESIGRLVWEGRRKMESKTYCCWPG